MDKEKDMIANIKKEAAAAADPAILDDSLQARDKPLQLCSFKDMNESDFYNWFGQYIKKVPENIRNSFFDQTRLRDEMKKGYY